MKLFLSMVLTISLAICYIPQIRQTIKTKCVEGINLSFWIILSIGLLANICLLLITNSGLFTICPQFVNLFCAVLMIVLVKKYK